MGGVSEFGCGRDGGCCVVCVGVDIEVEVVGFGSEVLRGICVEFGCCTEGEGEESCKREGTEKEIVSMSRCRPFE